VMAGDSVTRSGEILLFGGGGGDFVSQTF
jgi:hypothetical protein